jgi:glucose/arabinose dehydrogenase
MRLPRALVLSVLGTAVLAGCGDGGEDEATTAVESVPTATAPGDAGSGGGDLALRKIDEFDQPLFLTQPPGSSDLYVVEKPGRIRIVRRGETVGTPALDITDEVSDSGEQGLLSLAFAPDFESSRLAYVYFTGNDQDQHVVELTARDDGTFDPGSRREVLRMEDFASNHNGGLVLFGPDGQLYIGTGDGGSRPTGGNDPDRNGQDLGSLLGKLLRIDPRESGDRPYSVPADNPFVDRPGARAEVFAYGLRNPWRYSFDRETGALLIADVGATAQEEVDYVPAGKLSGANFGWSAFEGTQPANEDQRAPGAVRPILTYERDGGCSITGGYVVRDPSLPSLSGRYLYGDYCTGEIRSLVPAAGGARGDRPLGLEVPGLSSFGEDLAGHIYATSLEGPVLQLQE